jgi:hypothetical protein
MLRVLAVLLLLVSAAAVVAPPPARAQGDADTANMEILRQKLRADKKALVAANMQLTDVEARKFWPIYDAYQGDLQKINQRLGKLISDYAAAYNAGTVSNATAKKLLSESQAIEASELKLKQSYVPKLEQALPATKAARYLQIENKIRAVIRYELAAKIPLAQ